MRTRWLNDSTSSQELREELPRAVLQYLRLVPFGPSTINEMSRIHQNVGAWEVPRSYVICMGAYGRKRLVGRTENGA